MVADASFQLMPAMVVIPDLFEDSDRRYNEADMLAKVPAQEPPCDSTCPNLCDGVPSHCPSGCPSRRCI